MGRNESTCIRFLDCVGKVVKKFCTYFHVCLPIDFWSSVNIRLKCLVFSEIPLQLFNELPLYLAWTFMVPRG